MAKSANGRTAKPEPQVLRNLIISKPDSISVCSDIHVYIKRNFVRVTTEKRVFEIDAATDCVRHFPTSQAYQDDVHMARRMA
jgi:hypothetical protein